MAETRIVALDAVRGVAVMGILLANLPGFALPGAAYFSPRAWGGTAPADVAAWFAIFVLVEGKMRGLFSFLFGASTLLVIDRAGEDEARVHFARMAALFAIGCVHLYLIWGSDILAHYALVGSAAFMFRKLPVRWLVATGLALLALQLAEGLGGAAALWASAARKTPDAVRIWDWYAFNFGIPPRANLLEQVRAFRGDWFDQFRWRQVHVQAPVWALFSVGVETLGAMLLGMAAYRSGFLTGEWTRARYRRWTLVGLGIALPGYAALGLLTIASGFDQRWVFLGSLGLSPPLRTLGYVGYAAVIILLIRPDGWWTTRIAAVGRTAFTNYIGTSVLMTFVFYGWGLGQFGAWPRAQLYWLAPLVWGLMLAWSEPWLERYRYGPLEWLWRSLARLEWQPMRR